jgi:Rps23 Pro-64 3,4-dihydroxylase Tpa1-like proline 4-hydroxylase
LLYSHPSAAAPPDPAAGPESPLYRINRDLDLSALARAYTERGRVRIYGLLADGAVELHDYLESRRDWIHLISTEDDVLELDPAAKKRLGAGRWKAIEAGAHERARTGFQYRYQALRVPDDDELEGCHDPLTEFARLMQSDAMLDLLRAVTGHVGVAFTDGQATAYGHDDFLTCHDDDVAGKNRIAAYVYGLTPGWRLEWGGLLLFHGHADRTAEALVPRFNTLDLFSVPQRHSVSVVTPSASHRRFAVTGWLRGGSR